MNIGLNTLGFSPGRMGGTEIYFRELLYYLQKIDHQNSYTLFCLSHQEKIFSFPQPSFKIKTYPFFGKSSVKWFMRRLLRKTIGLDYLNARFDFSGVDVIHHPFSFFLKPIYQKTPSILTFWDMQHEFYPEFFSKNELRTRKFTYKTSVKLANRVLVASEFTRNCLIDRYDIEKEKIDVIYIGCGKTFRVISNRDELERVRRTYNLNRPFLFYPAAPWPHKNHRTLLKSLSILIDTYKFDGSLVLTVASMNSQKLLFNLVNEFGLTKWVKILGHVPYEDLPYLYNLARIMVFPSLFEGFGIPIVEAMASGCPVVCSMAACLPEIVGNSGLVFDPTCSEDLAEKIWHLWDDENQRRKLKLMALERVQMFSWENAARKTINVYEKVASL